jgi:nucleoside-diphosphate-sugar epimerase
VKALVTGSRGFVGSHVIEALAGHEILPEPAEYVDLDDAPPVDVVIALAASADPAAAMLAPLGAITNSASVMIETMEYARRVRARVLLVTSAEAGLTFAGYRPTGPYAAGKACQEAICGSYGDVHSAIVVATSLFGERQQRDRLVPQVIAAMLAGRAVKLQRGNEWASRPFMDVRDFAAGIVHLAAMENLPLRTHLGASRSVDLPFVVGAIGGALGCKFEIRAVPAGDRPGHEVHVEPIGCNVPGFRPRNDLLTALLRVARWYDAHREWLP